MRARGSLTIAAALVAALVMAPVPASASEPTDHLDPGTEGSLLDLNNAVGALESDAGLHNDGPAVGAGAGTDGCSAAMTRPDVEPDEESETGMAVSVRYSFQCVLDAGGETTFYIERMTQEGWKPEAFHPSVVPGGGMDGRPLLADCRAGTWRYRGKAEGTINFVTASSTITCVRRSDPFHIDQP